MSDENTPAFLLFKRGDMVLHTTKGEGMVERVTGERVSVQFRYSWRTSVVAAKNLTRIEGSPS